MSRRIGKGIMVYRTTRRAKDDIVDIFAKGLERFGRAQASAYHDRLEHPFELIAANPRLARERAEVTPPMRAHPCGVHVILYGVEPNDDVVILRVRHGREDWMSASL